MAKVGHQLQHGLHRIEGLERLLVAMAMHQRALRRGSQLQIEPAGLVLAGQEFLEGERERSSFVSSVGFHQRGNFIAERRMTARLQPDHRIPFLDVARSAASMRSASRTRLIDCADRQKGAAATERLRLAIGRPRDMHGVTRGIQDRNCSVEEFSRSK